MCLKPCITLPHLLFPVPEILCGDPPILPHTGQVWDGSSTPGSTVTYYCKIGFYHSEGSNVSLCTINGSWTRPIISCQGNNLLQPHVSTVDFMSSHSKRCAFISSEVYCGVPRPIPHSVMLWDAVSVFGSRVVYQCKPGYRNVGQGNMSVCTASGQWEAASLHCQGDGDVHV